MTIRHWLLFLLSAFLFGVPVLWSVYTWPLVFLFPIPLLYVALYNNFSWWYGYVWGIIAFTVHTGSVFWGIDTLADGSTIARWIPMLIIISYLSLFSLAWFTINNIIIRYFTIKTITQKLIFWTFSYWLFIIFMELHCFTIFGRAEGYFLFNPLFVLAEKPQLLTLMPYLGKSLLLLLVFCFAGSIVYAYVTKSAKPLLFVFIFSMPWLVSIIIPIPKTEAPLWLNKVAPLPAIVKEMVNLHEQALVAQNLLKKTANQYKDAELIIMPESSMLCSHLSTTPSICALWSEKELGRPLHIIVGSFRWDKSDFRNTLHWCYNGTLQKIFDKRHSMLLTEHIPPAFNMNVLEDLFFKTFSQVIPSTQPRPTFNIFNEVAFIPYICSELFFNDQPDDNYNKGTTILATTNDFWCKDINMAHLMHLAARLRAIQWQRNILYISFLYATYYDIYGNQFDIRNTNS